MKNLKFYKCSKCGKVLLELMESDSNIICCEDGVAELNSNTFEASFEKHLPVVNITKNIVEVKIGAAPHPSLPEHHINFVILETDKGFKVEYMEVGKMAEAKFLLAENETPLNALCFCNLHGLWKTKN